MLSICGAFEFLPLYKRTFRFTPAIPLDCTVPRIRSGFLPTCEAQQDFTPTQKWRRHFCRQRTTFAAFTLSLQNGKRAASFPFAELLHTCFFKREHSASRLKSQFSSLKSVFFPRHSFTQFSNLSFLIHSPTSLLLPLPCLFCFPAVNAIMKYNEKNVALFIELCTVLYFRIEVFL